MGWQYLCPVLFLVCFSKLNVHLVSHTHDDVGWLKTVDQYYYGANNSIQNAGVQYILDTVIRELYDSPQRKFTYVEQAFFQRWWNEQDDKVRHMVKVVVDRGQLEWSNGGWCMHDEAATHFVAMIDQTTLGHRLLKKQFGEKGIPKATWQIDPFGHSSTQASLLSARAGFEAVYFARIDYQDSQRRRATKEYEMLWRPSPSLGLTGQVFAGAFPTGTYCPPTGFDWDKDSNDAPIQDDKRLEDYNVPSRVQDFINVAKDIAAVTKGNDIMLTMGCDFQYSNARTWFKNLDKLIKYVNLDGRVNAFYSTPGMYTKAKLASNITWPVKTDDFFPYADHPNAYWTGYFTSRSALKKYVRMNSAYLNAARQMEVFTGKALHSNFQEAMGLAQHHDAVSGTSKQHVAYDYARHIANGVKSADSMMSEAFQKVLKKSSKANASFVQCHLTNESYCSFTQQNNNFVVTVYNPLARTTSQLIRIPVNGGNYIVTNSSGKMIPSQVAPSFAPFPKQVTPSPNTLYFLATAGPMGTNTYFVKKSGNKPTPKEANDKKLGAVIQNSAVSLSYDATSGQITQITNKITSSSVQVKQEFLYYEGLQSSDQNSGAYIFRPKTSNTFPVCKSKPTLSVVNGPVVSELRVTCQWIAQTYRIIQNQEFIEVEYHIGQIPIQDGQGKEVVSRFSTSVQSGSTWYTDSNGREYQQRILNYRPSWNYSVNQPVSGNYYPVNVGIYIKDASNQFSLLTDRSYGGTSLNSGQLELMVQRRLLFDDSRGVGEPLNETDAILPYDPPPYNGNLRLGTCMHVNGVHRLLVDSSNDGFSMRKIREEQSKFFSPMVVQFSSYSNELWKEHYLLSATMLNTSLPINVEIMTLQDLGEGEYMIRLAHQFAINEDSTYSAPVTVSFKDLFNFQMRDIKEVSLTTNRDIKDVPFFNWKGEEGKSNENTLEIIPFTGDQVVVNPMDIRTFTFKKA